MLVMAVDGHRCTLLVITAFSWKSEAARAETYFRHVASAGQEDVVRELLGAGADVKQANDKGLTPL